MESHALVKLIFIEKVCDDFKFRGFQEMKLKHFFLMKAETLDTSPKLWMNLQATYDLNKALKMRSA